MSILIKGSNMPKYTYEIKLTYFYADEEGNEATQTEIITADQIAKVSTPHGRLLDENDVKNTFKFSEDAEYARWTLAGVLMDIEDTEAVLESEE